MSDVVISIENLVKKYRIRYGCGSATSPCVTIDYVPEALRFHVLEVAENDVYFEPHDIGSVRFSANWSQPSRLK